MKAKLLTAADIQKLTDDAQAELKKTNKLSDLQQIKAKLLGKKSLVQSQIELLPNLDADAKAKLGRLINQAKKSLTELFTIRQADIINSAKFDQLDVTRPGIGQDYGHLHPVSQILDQTYQVFTSLGFAIIDGPEIENDWYNFEALNMPPDHPARDMQDTFYLKNQHHGRPLIPRTHTSNVQVRFMEKHQPPIKIIVPGRVFRNENEDMTHAWIFHQIEGLVVGENITLADLKGTLFYTIKGILDQAAEVRLRPSFFPYTEPSVEIDAKYQGKWLELGGAGMIHPQVIKNAGLDSTRYSGFAFGWGPERVAMIKYKISDIRSFWRPKLDYLEQF